MAFTEYRSGTPFPGRIGRSADQSDPAWPVPNRVTEKWSCGESLMSHEAQIKAALARQ